MNWLSDIIARLLILPIRFYQQLADDALLFPKCRRSHHPAT